jgi:hypothetical protein
LEGASKLPIAGWAANKGGEDIDVGGGLKCPPKLGGAGIVEAIGGEIGDMAGNAIL